MKTKRRVGQALCHNRMHYKFELSKESLWPLVQCSEFEIRASVNLSTIVLVILRVLMWTLHNIIECYVVHVRYKCFMNSVWRVLKMLFPHIDYDWQYRFYTKHTAPSASYIASVNDYIIVHVAVNLSMTYVLLWSPQLNKFTNNLLK